jgi:hypothetical protein
MTTVIVLIVLVGVGLLALALQKRFARVRAVAGGLMLSYFVIVAALVGGELYLRYGYADSRMEFGLHGQNWRNRYVQLNSLGYRDRDWTPEELDSLNSVLVLGDSFTEGWGLNDPSDRYTEVLERLLGEGWAVVEIARAGYATEAQQRGFDNYPYKTPDVVIWQYFPNDIEVAAKSNGMQWDYDIPPIPPLAEESYLASFIYWRANYDRLFVNTVDGRSEWEFYYAAYDNPYIWGIHKAEIERLTRDIQATGARLIVVIFPNMVDPMASIPYVDRVEQAFEEFGVTEILKLTDEAAAWALPDRIVSPFDSHASIAFNHRVGQMIYERFFQDR